jgi:dihydroorotate dehydrogenase (fumarate)
MDLTTTYMGMELKHPIVASAAPLSGSVANIKRLEDAGAAAVVMFSLFEEQLKHESAALEYLMTAGTESFAESLNYFPEVDDYTVGPDNYLELLRQASAAVDIPIIGSLNGITNTGWIEYAQLMQEAGAKGIELNIYYIPADLTTSGREVEERYVGIVKAVKAAVTVPVAVKLNPFFSAIGSMAKALDDAGADALVLFNRFYQPDFDLDKLEVAPNLNLSTPDEIRLPLLWIASSARAVACLTGRHPRRAYPGRGGEVSDGGRRCGDDHLGPAQERHRLYDHPAQRLAGPGWNAPLYVGTQMKGSMSQRKVADPTAFERANYIKTLESYKGDYL